MHSALLWKSLRPRVAIPPTASSYKLLTCCWNNVLYLPPSFLHALACPSLLSVLNRFLLSRVCWFVLFFPMVSCTSHLLSGCWYFILRQPRINYCPTWSQPLPLCVSAVDSTCADLPSLRRWASRNLISYHALTLG